MYAVKEIFYTLQGEGFQSGRPAVFCRFSGCNLWSGREQDRSKSACTFCDTDFVGVDGVNGGKYPDDGTLPYKIADQWPHHAIENRLVVFTGGEPLLQLDEPLIRAMHALGFKCAVESNGTQVPPSGIDWLTVSPKGSAPLKVTRANELKLVFPPARRYARDVRTLRCRPVLPATYGRTGSGSKHAGCRRVLQGPSKVAAKHANTQVPGIP
jgi:7-carboxy-7-deazaguanine synthase